MAEKQLPSLTLKPVITAAVVRLFLVKVSHDLGGGKTDRTFWLVQIVEVEYE